MNWTYKGIPKIEDPNMIYNIVQYPKWYETRIQVSDGLQVEGIEMPDPSPTNS